MAAQDKYISIVGAREHNLKDISIDIPRDTLTVVTGLSGSGKSSLAFDTVYAEGQRRYVESLSSYARQFLEQMQKPEVEHIEGLPPTIAIEQRRGSVNPRSTVATVTEIYDYLRLLFARVGTPHCHKCGRQISQQTAQQITDRIMSLEEGTRFMVMAPLIRGRKGEHKEVIARAKREGFVRLRIDGELVEAREIKVCENKKKKHTIEAVIDRIVMKEGVESRLNDSVETALRMGEGLCIASHLKEDGDWEDVLYSEVYACPDCDISFEELAPRMFSFNSPYGACETCSGLGTRLELDPELIVPDKNISIDEGAVAAWRKGGKRMTIYYNRMLREFAADYGVSLATPWRELSDDIKDVILYGDEDPGFEGVIPNLEYRFHNTDSEYVKQRIHTYMTVQPCQKCKGLRLRPESLAVKIEDLSIMGVTALTIERALEFFTKLELKGEKSFIAEPIVKEVSKRLTFLQGVGLDYLSLDRTAGTLSGGEFQRIRLASQVGSGLVGVCYVLDEPTIGLHQRDNQRLLKTLLEMRDLGNTVIVVEHDEEIIRAADYIADLGPGAGAHGGEIIAEGDVDAVIKNENSLTGGYLAGDLEIEIPEKRRKAYARSGIRIKGAKENNLKNIDVSFPLGVLTCVTGVSGSGKSTLVNEIFYKALARELNHAKYRPGKFKSILGTGNVDKIINIDQTPIGKTPRSNPATYTGIFDQIRSLFAKTSEAKIRGYQAGRFSFNVKGGRCEACQGQGVMKIEMHFLPDVYVRCEECKGRRYNRETLEVKFKGYNIADILDMQIGESIRIFKNHPQIYKGLMTLADVGLGYIALGQSSTTLSGGEAQRVKLASELQKRSTGRTVYVLDEPTTGLHFDDIKKLLKVLHRLVDKGNTIIVIEHNLDVIKCADYIVDLGPEGGEHGGTVLAKGSPEDVAEVEESYTGQFLKKILG
ncbi:MAG: excinuclease ABC subunit UvrA [Planctomycetota bacterium]|jgi:excinuclease ABC subunit A